VALLIASDCDHIPFASPLTGIVTDAHTVADRHRHRHRHSRRQRHRQTQPQPHQGICHYGNSCSRERLTLFQQRGFRALARSQQVKVFTTCSVSGCPLLTASCVLLKWMPAHRRSWRERRAGDMSPPDVLSTCCSAASLALRSSVNNLQQC